jgi:uncharacterized membrane protein YhaH (DUF805 family)
VLREAAEQYNSWWSQAAIYISVFAVTVAFSVYEEERGVFVDRILFSVVIWVFTLLVAIPVFFVTARRWVARRRSNHYGLRASLTAKMDVRSPVDPSTEKMPDYSSVDQEATRLLVLKLLQTGELPTHIAMLLFAVLHGLHNMEEEDYLLNYEPNQSEAYGAGYRAGQRDASRAVLGELRNVLVHKSAEGSEETAPVKERRKIFQHD